MPLFYFIFMMYHKVFIILFAISIISCKKNDAIANEKLLVESISVNDSISVSFVKKDSIINDSVSLYFQLEKPLNNHADVFYDNLAFKFFLKYNETNDFDKLIIISDNKCFNYKKSFFIELQSLLELKDGFLDNKKRLDLENVFLNKEMSKAFFGVFEEITEKYRQIEKIVIDGYEIKDTKNVNKIFIVTYVMYFGDTGMRYKLFYSIESGKIIRYEYI